jgi:hypothetical protein
MQASFKSLCSITKEAKGVRVYDTHQQWDDPHHPVIKGGNGERDV